ncbi:universal stress protein [Muricoccus vinaceus]|uniref:Universal stress protein n=1 Tax=Muricoccus vinaceus TaxID=424704 RepID=A0ABV6IUW5_9PROT
MSDVVLVVLQRLDAAAHLLRAAERLAALAGAGRVNVLAVHTPPGYVTISPEASVSPLLDELLAFEETRIAALHEVYQHWAAGVVDASLTTHWSSVQGLADPIVNEGRQVDFVVVGRPARDDDPPTKRAFHAALFKTGRPVLVVPRRWDAEFGHSVAVAWREDSRAANAVLPALRYLQGAAPLHVLVGLRQGTAHPHLPRIFADHGVQAELHVLPLGPEVFGQKLLDKARELDIDLLIMGAYAHSPLVEALLGGVTRYVLAHADLPLLMRH